MLNRFITYVVE